MSLTRIMFLMIDKRMGAPIIEGISVGWVLATGPDNQPFELSRLAEYVNFDGSKLILTGLRKTEKYSGGLRGQCIISTEGLDALEVPEMKSDVFAIYISPEPSVDPEESKEPEDVKGKGLPDRWLPGPGKNGSPHFLEDIANISICQKVYFSKFLLFG